MTKTNLFLISSENQFKDAYALSAEVVNPRFLCACCGQIKILSRTSKYHSTRAPKTKIKTIFKAIYNTNKLIRKSELNFIYFQDIGPLVQLLAYFVKRKHANTYMVPDGLVHHDVVFRIKGFRKLVWRFIAFVTKSQVKSETKWGGTNPKMIFSLYSYDQIMFRKNGQASVVTGSPRLFEESKSILELSDQNMLLVCSTPPSELPLYCDDIESYYKDLFHCSENLAHLLGLENYSIKLHPGEILDGGIPDFIKRKVFTGQIAEAISKSRYVLTPLSTVAIEADMSKREVFLWVNHKLPNLSDFFVENTDFFCEDLVKLKKGTFFLGADPVPKIVNHLNT